LEENQESAQSGNERPEHDAAPYMLLASDLAACYSTQPNKPFALSTERVNRMHEKWCRCFAGP